MRVWDIHPGYLNTQSLLGEHRELHGISSIIKQNKRGYSRHPETMRWRGYGWALRQRHRLLVAEMRLRGFRDRTPITLRSNRDEWPAAFVDPPDIQFALLRRKYANKKQGRIVLPRNAMQLWAQHKYSVLARDPQAYKTIGNLAAKGKNSDLFCDLAIQLTELLRKPVTKGRLRNVLLHMWGHVKDYFPIDARQIERMSSRRLLLLIQKSALSIEEPYLTASTALSELALWY